MPVHRSFVAVVVVLLCVTVRAGAQEGADWTAVTMAREGSWDVETAESQSQAIGIAIRDCRAMSTGQGDCGAEFTTIKGGWTLAFR